MNVFALSDFVERVPIFSVDAGLKDVLWELLEHPSERAILYRASAHASASAPLSSQFQPLGVLALEPLLSVLRSPSRPSLSHSTHQAASLKDLIEQYPTLLEPLSLLPTPLSQLEFQQQLEHSSVSYWLVDLAAVSCAVSALDDPPTCLGDRWGLLNRQHLLQRLTGRTSGDTALTAPASHHSSEYPTIHWEALVNLVQQLPLPLMLQTRTGEIVCQNTAWRVQVGQESVGQESTEAIATSSASGHRASANPSSPEILSSTPSSEAARHRRSESAPAIPIEGMVCELRALSALNAANSGWQTLSSVAPGEPVLSSFCVCIQTNGEERVWELLKLPLVPGLDVADKSDLADDLWLVAAQDRTEQHQLARELAVKTADLEQLNRFKNEFLSCISHEMKTPLTALLGLSTLLKDQLLGPLNERQIRYAQLIHQSGRHLIMLVNDILDVSRLETGQLHLKLEAVAIETMCRQAYDQARQWQTQSETEPLGRSLSSPQSSVPRFELQIQPGLKTLIADPLRLRQMLANLLLNSIQFTEAGTIGLEVEVWERWLAFTVWDTGVGISADQQALLFQTFQPAEAISRKGEGTGLGLALTQRLARLHGGELTFISRQGTGSWFTLMLPFVPPQALGTPLGLTCPMPPAGKPLVLVAIANGDWLKTVLECLQQLGCGVAIARTGPESLEKIRLLQPTAVLISPNLPLLPGWDVLTLIKSSPETRSIPLWMVGSTIEEAQAISTGADGFLNLPLPPVEIQRQLRPLLNLEPPTPHPTVFTVLHLRVGTCFATSSGEASLPELSELLQSYPCRLLEVDDLDQADLLARVWHPDLVLLEGEMPDPASFLHQFSQSDLLRSLPLVTLTLANTQAANQIAGLAVYPCLAPLSATHDGQPPAAEALLQVMQVALGLR